MLPQSLWCDTWVTHFPLSQLLGKEWLFFSCSNNRISPLECWGKGGAFFKSAGFLRRDNHIVCNKVATSVHLLHAILVWLLLSVNSMALYSTELLPKALLSASFTPKSPGIFYPEVGNPTSTLPPPLSLWRRLHSHTYFISQFSCQGNKLSSLSSCMLGRTSVKGTRPLLMDFLSIVTL